MDFILNIFNHLVKLSCMPDIKAFLNHSHLADTITRCARNVCTCMGALWNSIPCTSNVFLNFTSFAVAVVALNVCTSNSISATWAECKRRKAFFDKLLFAAMGGSHKCRIRFSLKKKNKNKIISMKLIFYYFLKMNKSALVV